MTTPEPVDPEAVRAALVEAIEGALSRFGEFATRWVVIAEALGADNERGLWLAVTPGARQWDTVGLLTYGLERERAQIVAEMLRDD
jgi:hypothetical protein